MQPDLGDGLRARSIGGGDVVATLERVCREHGYPQSIRVGQGAEFIPCDLDLWACQKEVLLDFLWPENPPAGRSKFGEHLSRPWPSPHDVRYRLSKRPSIPLRLAVRMRCNLI